MDLKHNTDDIHVDFPASLSTDSWYTPKEIWQQIMKTGEAKIK